jgi:hypothetical protein
MPREGAQWARHTDDTEAVGWGECLLGTQADNCVVAVEEEGAVEFPAADGSLAEGADGILVLEVDGSLEEGADEILEMEVDGSLEEGAEGILEVVDECFAVRNLPFSLFSGDSWLHALPHHHYSTFRWYSIPLHHTNWKHLSDQEISKLAT